LAPRERPRLAPRERPRLAPRERSRLAPRELPRPVGASGALGARYFVSVSAR
jgi:hypothetical protein